MSQNGFEQPKQAPLYECHKLVFKQSWPC